MAVVTVTVELLNYNCSEQAYALSFVVKTGII
jgi:hypothetical protein